MTREELWRIARKAWVLWAYSQMNPKPSWLMSYDTLPAEEKEADNLIGTAVYDAVRAELIGGIEAFEREEFKEHTNYQVSNALDRLVLRLREEGGPK